MNHFPDALFDFISRHAYDDPTSLRLRFGHKEDGFSTDFAIDQIEARRKASGRLAKLLKHERFLFPALICAEQASSSAIATFHTELISSGESVLDLTCGLGSDAMSLAEKASMVVAIERDSWYCEVMKHNLKELRLTNIDVENADCEDWLESSDCRFDVIFADPHRRDGSNGRTYSFADCSPDVSAIAPSLISRCSRLLIKASPMLDIRLAASEISGCDEIFAVAERGECKELLISARPNGVFQKITAINITSEGVHKYSISSDMLGRGEDIDISMPNELSIGYLYEPNAATMKLQCSDAFAKDFLCIKRVGSNTALYWAERIFDTFPGRILRIVGIVSKQELKMLKGKRFNVVSRNHPLRADELASKLKLKPSDNEFLYAISAGRGKGKRLILQAVLLKSN